MKDKRGFTLLELLMVVIIIAILASIAIPQYFKAAERARSSEALQMLATMRGSETRYYAEWANYSNNTTLMDFAPATSNLWTYSVASATNNFVNAVRTINQGGSTANHLDMNLTSGTACSANAVYGLPTTC